MNQRFAQPKVGEPIPRSLAGIVLQGTRRLGCEEEGRCAQQLPITAPARTYLRAPSTTKPIMNFRILASAAVALLLGACTDQAAGQKGHTTALATTMDSVSYGIGTDIGHNMKVGGLDSLNVDALAMGIRDGLDSAEKITGEKVRALVQAYMIEAQKKSMAKQQAKSEENLRKGEAAGRDFGNSRRAGAGERAAVGASA